MLTVQIQDQSELSAAEREEWGGEEWNQYLRVTHNGETVILRSDSMEPEDALFRRDLRWIVGAIQKAYELGKADAPR